MSSAAVAPSPEAAADSRKRRWHGELQEDSAPKRRYADARRALDWVAHLCARYPGMSDKDIALVLDACGGDVEATIRRLDELSLTVAARAAANAAGPSAEGQQQPDGTPAAEAAARAAAAAAAPSADVSAGAPAGAEAWVDVVVQEMAASTDLPDARARAARLLAAFEAAVRGCGGGGGGGDGGARGALDAALRDNAILKRAVAIQNARQQEAAAATEAAVAELRAQLAAQAAQLHAAQLNAYSLSVHLREALDGRADPRGPARNPDVF